MAIYFKKHRHVVINYNNLHKKATSISWAAKNISMAQTLHRYQTINFQKQYSIEIKIYLPLMFDDLLATHYF